MQIRKLSVLAYANGFTLWHYLALKETKADVMADNFFIEAAEMLSKGDMILVSCSDGGSYIYVSSVRDAKTTYSVIVEPVNA